MISLINGKVVDKTNGTLTVLVGGVGFCVFATADAYDAATVGNEIMLYTHMAVKEDDISLFGFASKEERDMFLRLISISGIGPKMAISILSGISAEDLAVAIYSGQVSVLSKVKGVGKKTAERIVLELKEQVAETVANKKLEAKDEPQEKGKLSPEAQDAVYGLVALGIRETEATRVVQMVYTSGMSAEETITKALKGLR